jgi:hypothetical protein
MRDLSALPSPIAETVRAVLGHNHEALKDRITYQPQPCNRPEDTGLGGTPCERDEAPGTIVPGFLVAGCDGSFQRPDQAVTTVTHWLDATTKLYAAFRGTQAPGKPEQTILLFLEPGPNGGSSVRLYANDDGTFDALIGTCNPLELTLRGVTNFIIPPPPAGAP